MALKSQGSFGKQPMPSAGRVVQNTGVNKHGNEYKAYDDGAYAYKNYKAGKKSR